MIKQARDGRRQPQIPASVIFTLLLAGLVLRTKSMEELDRKIRKGRFQRLLPPKERFPSHDTIRYVLCQGDLEQLACSHYGMMEKWKRNRAPKKRELSKDGAWRRSMAWSCSTESAIVARTA
ncbi:transposase family protein [Ferroacidibacillus organovorans]|nr:transposase family protein [Ferroacidibacillus organovorans]